MIAASPATNCGPSCPRSCVGEESSPLGHRKTSCLKVWALKPLGPLRQEAAVATSTQMPRQPLRSIFKMNLQVSTLSPCNSEPTHRPKNRLLLNGLSAFSRATTDLAGRRRGCQWCADWPLERSICVDARPKPVFGEQVLWHEATDDRDPLPTLCQSQAAVHDFNRTRLQLFRQAHVDEPLFRHEFLNENSLDRVFAKSPRRAAEACRQCRRTMSDQVRLDRKGQPHTRSHVR